jgi:hypothetical protein
VIWVLLFTTYDVAAVTVVLPATLNPTDVRLVKFVPVITTDALCVTLVGL